MLSKLLILRSRVKGKCREMDIHFLIFLNGTANPARAEQVFSIDVSIISRKVTKSTTVPDSLSISMLFKQIANSMLYTFLLKS